uniref:Peptidase A1 domain-containing protein n=1 Tax=Hyaloperonospora arabidopsidis (strain Emoy2) TaxID=559515 RepID=M4BGJ7_HYAAE
MLRREVLGQTSALLSCLLLLLGQQTKAESARYSLNLTGIASGTDTGSSNDAVLGSGCCGPEALATYSCEASSTCVKPEENAVTLAFAGANIEGQFLTDTWSSSEIGNISKTFLVIEEQDTFFRSTYDGITGLAYEALAASTGELVPSLYNVLVGTGNTTDGFGMLLCGTMQPMLQTTGTDFTYHSGQLMIGGIEGTSGEVYYTGSMLYTPITRVVTDIGYNGKSLGLPCDNYNTPQAIMDSGSSNLAFPPNVYNALMNQIKVATLAAIPDFDTSYFDASTSCCDETYCDPTSSSAALLELPSIYFTLGMEAVDGSTTKHFTIEIPPEYYWRPEMNGVNASAPCRAIGISEGTSTVLGDVFMDGLYSYHDRAEGKIGLAVADNCPNNVNSTKKVYASADSVDWCSCFSNTLKKKSSWSTYVPWGTGCFFWQWWMYVVIASFFVVIACVCVLIWWQRTNNYMKRIQEEAYIATSAGACTSRFSTVQSFGGARPAPSSSLSSYYAAPTPPPKRKASTYSTQPGPRQEPMQPPRSQTSRAKQRERTVPMMDEPKYSGASSPRSPLSSTSSIALLSEGSFYSSMGSSQAQSNQQRSHGYGYNSSHTSSNSDRWGASLRENHS